MPKIRPLFPDRSALCIKPCQRKTTSTRLLRFFDDINLIHPEQNQSYDFNRLRFVDGHWMESIIYDHWIIIYNYNRHLLITSPPVQPQIEEARALKLICDGGGGVSRSCETWPATF